MQRPSHKVASQSHGSFGGEAASSAAAAQSTAQQQAEGRQAPGTSDVQLSCAQAASGSNSIRDDSRATASAAPSAACSHAAGSRLVQHKHYSHGQKLAAAVLWETASGKSQPVHLRQCLTYSEIRMKNLAGRDDARLPLPGTEHQEPARCIALEA